MADRYSTITREVPVDRPRNTIYMGGDGSRDRESEPRFHTTGYRCPVHGAWTALGEHQETVRPCTVVVGDLPDLRFCCEPSQRNPPDPETAPGVINSQHRVSLHPAGFRVRERGALDATVVHAYRCPVHGLVDVRVPRADVPDEVTCESSEPRYRGQMACCDCLLLHEPNRGIVRCDCGADVDTALWCGTSATWAGSQAGQGWAAGECKS